MIDDNYIINNCFRKDNIVNGNIIYTDELRSYLENRYDDIPYDMFSYREVLQRIRLHIDKRPVCPICGKPLKYLGSTNIENMYRKTCSTKCGKELAKIKTANTWKNKTEEEKQRIKEKSKQTCLKRFGFEYSFQSENNKRKSRETCLRKYGEERYGQYGSNSFKQNMLKKYGYEHPQSSDIVRNKISKALSSKESQDKLKKTNLKRYGVEYVSQLEEVQDKVYQSSINHKSFKTSNEEQILYNLLTEIYPDIQRFYKNKQEYNYNCDFYIPSLKLYIEYQGSGYHFERLYNKERDENLLKSLQEKAKTKPYINDIIYTWTELDIEKWNVAKQQHINILFLYPKFNKQWKYYITHLDRTNVKSDLLECLKTLIDNSFYGKNNVQMTYGEKL